MQHSITGATEAADPASDTSTITPIVNSFSIPTTIVMLATSTTVFSGQIVASTTTAVPADTSEVTPRKRYQIVGHTTGLLLVAVSEAKHLSLSPWQLNSSYAHENRSTRTS